MERRSKLMECEEPGNPYDTAGTKVLGFKAIGSRNAHSMTIMPGMPSAAVRCCYIFRATSEVTMIQAAQPLETV